MSRGFILHFDILGENDTLTRPKTLFIRPHKNADHDISNTLKYQADLLAGLNLYLLCQPQKSTTIIHVSPSLRAFDPHHALYEGAQDRLSHWLRKKSPVFCQSNLMSNMAEILTGATHEEGLDLTKLMSLISLFERMETQLKRPLLFNFDLALPNDILGCFHVLANLLFYVRALVLSDYNQQIQDPTFEAIRMDSVSDYLPKLESVAHDATIYAHFRRLEAQMPTLVAQRLKDVFQSHSAMGATLIDAIERNKPSQSFGKDLCENMNRVQIDWLFGTPSGICHRLREELVALRDGYQNVFHIDIATDFKQQNASWSFDCSVPNLITKEYPAA